MINTIHREKIIYTKKSKSQTSMAVYIILYTYFEFGLSAIAIIIIYSVHDARHDRHVLIKGVPTPMYS